jgi:DUF2946 family protein
VALFGTSGYDEPIVPEHFATMKGMRHIKKTHWATLVVLGLLFLRALIPAGFMLAPVDGHLVYVLCDAEVSAAGHHHDHSGHDNAAHHGGTHGDPTCPYAQSAGPAPLPTLPVLASADAFDHLVAPSAVTQTFLSFGPPRRLSSRGPPSAA